MREAFDEENWPVVEERVRRLLFEKPKDFWSLPKLQNLYKTDRLPNLKEILGKAFGLVPNIPTRAELADEAFERFIITENADATPPLTGIKQAAPVSTSLICREDHRLRPIWDSGALRPQSRHRPHPR